MWLILKHCVEGGIFAQANNGNIVDETLMDAPSSLKIKITKNLISEKDYEFLNTIPTEEPLYKKTTDFVGFDVGLFDGDLSLTGVLLPDPSFAYGEDSGVCLVSYPGYDHRETIDKILSQSLGDDKPPFEWVKERLYKFSHKCASFGKVLGLNDSVITYDCCAISGSSTGPIIRVDTQNAEFVGIHEGGEYEKADKTPYNYAYSVHHPGIVLVYAKYIYPRFLVDGEVPACLLHYLGQHLTLLEENALWIGNPALLEVLRTNINLPASRTSNPRIWSIISSFTLLLQPVRSPPNKKRRLVGHE